MATKIPLVITAGKVQQLQAGDSIAVGAACLLADGTRELTGNLAVTATKTIDGRDISVDGAALDTLIAGCSYAAHTGTTLVTTSAGSLPPTVMGEFALFTGVLVTDQFSFEMVNESFALVTKTLSTNIGWAAANTFVLSMAVYGGKLYVGSFNAGGSQVWSLDGAVWAGANIGWAAANTNTYSMAVYGGKLYVGSSNAGGSQVWSFNGAAWANANIGWAAANTGAYSMAVYGGKLYVGSCNAGGGQVWTYGSYTPQIYVLGTTCYVNWNENDCAQDYWRVRKRSS